MSPELWDAAQALLAANNFAKRTGLYARDPSILTGLLYDDRGNRLTPVQNQNKGKIYRYYLSQAVIQRHPDKQGQVRRLPADEVERPVTRRLEAFLASGQELLDRVALPSDDVATHKALLAGAQAWKNLSQREPAQVRAFLLAALLRVSVEETGAQISVSRSGYAPSYFAARKHHTRFSSRHLIVKSTTMWFS